MFDPTETPSARRLTTYFVPLALQAASQSLSYPLVAMVAAHGEGGALNLAGLAQSNILMFMVATLGAGLVTAGMVFARTRQGYARFIAINNLLSLATALIQAALCIPAVGHLVFSALLGLPASIERPAQQAFPFTILLNVLFYARNPYQVLLYNNGASGRASTATLARIGLTLMLSPLFCSWGIVGPRWAMVCQSIPVALETLVSWWHSRPFAAALAEDVVPAPSRHKILLFTLPLSLGGFLMTLSGMILGAVIARAGQPEHMLPAYYLAAGVVNPAAYAASRVQNVVISFPPRAREDTSVLRFSVAAGAIFSLIPLVFLLPRARPLVLRGRAALAVGRLVAGLHHIVALHRLSDHGGPTLPSRGTGRARTSHAYYPGRRLRLHRRAGRGRLGVPGPQGAGQRHWPARRGKQQSGQPWYAGSALA